MKLIEIVNVNGESVFINPKYIIAVTNYTIMPFDEGNPKSIIVFDGFPDIKLGITPREVFELINKDYEREFK